jgi:hypothetical protein
MAKQSAGKLAESEPQTTKADPELLRSAIEDLRAYLLTGDPAKDDPSILFFFGDDTVRELQARRDTLHAQCALAAGDAELSQVSDLIPMTAFVRDSELNRHDDLTVFMVDADGIRREYRKGDETENVRSDVLDCLTRAMERLRLIVPSGEVVHSADLQDKEPNRQREQAFRARVSDLHLELFRGRVDGARVESRTVHDTIGPRTFPVPAELTRDDELALWPTLFHAESITGVRLHDGGDPFRFLRLCWEYESSNVRGTHGLTFAQFAERSGCDAFDIATTAGKVVFSGTREDVVAFFNDAMDRGETKGNKIAPSTVNRWGKNRGGRYPFVVQNVGENSYNIIDVRPC